MRYKVPYFPYYLWSLNYLHTSTINFLITLDLLTVNNWEIKKTYMLSFHYFVAGYLEIPVVYLDPHNDIDEFLLHHFSNNRIKLRLGEYEKNI